MAKRAGQFVAAQPPPDTDRATSPSSHERRRRGCKVPARFQARRR